MSWLARVQAPVQSFLRPGVWVPGLRTPHVYQETWRVRGSIERALEDVVAALETVSLHSKEVQQIHKVDRETGRVRVFYYTPVCQWLDVLEVTFDSTLAKSSDGWCSAKVRCFSSGVLPVVVPLSFLLNCLFCWVPFSDVHKNRHRIMALRDNMQLEVGVESEGRPC